MRTRCSEYSSPQVQQDQVLRARELQARVRELQARVQELQARVRALQARVRVLQARVQELQAQVQELQARVQELQARVQELQARVRVLLASAAQCKSKSHRRHCGYVVSQKAVLLPGRERNIGAASRYRRSHLDNWSGSQARANKHQPTISRRTSSTGAGFEIDARLAGGSGLAAGTSLVLASAFAFADAVGAVSVDDTLIDVTEVRFSTLASSTIDGRLFEDLVGAVKDDETVVVVVVVVVAALASSTIDERLLDDAVGAVSDDRRDEAETDWRLDG